MWPTGNKVCRVLRESYIMSSARLNRITCNSLNVYNQTVRVRYASNSSNKCPKIKSIYSPTDDMPISWYPGHIMKAEKELKEQLKKVDVVIEVRDARIPLATTHPKVPEWVGSRPLIVAMVRTDMIAKAAMRQMTEYYAELEAAGKAPKTVFINGKRGTGVAALRQEVMALGRVVNERRVRHGMSVRPVRAAIIGYPNVGKSTLINRILGKKIAKTEDVPGVTRQISWVRLGGSGNNNSNSSSSINWADSAPSNGKGNARQQDKGTFELLDSPGIIPPGRATSLDSALLLAVCNQIGQASYDRVRAAKALLIALLRLHKTQPHFVDMSTIQKRYKLPTGKELSAEDIFDHVCETICQDCEVSTANKLLGDFRKGHMGYNSLEMFMLAAPETTTATTAEAEAEAEAVMEAEHEDLKRNREIKKDEKEGTQ